MTDPCAPATIVSADGARLTCCAHGGQVLGWVPAGSTHDRLWLSPRSRCGPHRAIRGGVPVIFPQFAGRGPLPKHGFARDRPWRVLPPITLDDGIARWSARLQDDDATRALWPHSFAVQMDVSAAGADLRLVLTIRNRGEEPFAFAAALHSYLRLSEDRATTIAGLGGRPTEADKATGSIRNLPPDPFLAVGILDAITRDAQGPINLNDPLFGPLTIEADGFPDRVLWNPGPGHNLIDVPAGTEREFICIEPAALDSRTLGPTEQWSAAMVLSVG
jgi:glucose-6-phosphate 1-epimerase